jgi:hypothetical protein
MANNKEESIKKLNEELDKLQFNLQSIAGSLTERLNNSLSSASNEAEKLVGAFERGENITQKLQNQLDKVQQKNNNLNLNELKLKKDLILAQIKNNIKAQEAINKAIYRNRLASEQLDKTTDILNNLKKHVEEEEQITKEKQKQNSLTNALGNALQKNLGFNIANVKETLTLTGLMTMLIESALKANKQTVELGKSLGRDSYQYRENLADVARSSSNINVSTENLVGAYTELSQSTGLAYEFSQDQLETQIKLTKQVGLQAEDAAQILGFSILTGKTSEQTYKSFIKGLVATSNQLKVSINFKATLAEALKVSGQLAATLGYNPERIAKAIVTAKAFGMTLEQVAKSGESLLNFETSIENELKAELITGRQLNLERARAAALSGDQVTLAEELAKNIGSSADFTKMNVLQQKALAESVGMTADELADTLKKREQALASGKSLAQVTEDEVTKSIERQNIQDKFNNTILKLQDSFNNLVAGPLGEFVDSLSKGLEYVIKIFGYFGKIFSLIKSIPGVGGVLSGIVSAVTVGTLISLVAKSMTKGTTFNPMITKDIGSSLGGGDIMDMFGGGRGGAASRGRMLRNLTGSPRGSLRGLGNLAKGSKLLKGGGLLSLLGAGIDLTSNITDENRSTGDALLKTLDQNKFTALGAGIGALFGGVGAIPGAAIGGLLDFALGDATQMVEDGIAPSSKGPFTITDSYGAMAITKKGDGLAVSPNINNSPVDLTPMITAINEVKAAVDRLYSKDTTINMDGKRVGSTLTQGSYKVA